MLYKRILIGVPLFFIVYGILWWEAGVGSAWGITLAMMIASLACLREFYRFARCKGWLPFALLGYIMVVVFSLAHEQWLLVTWHDGAHLVPEDLPGVYVSVISIFVLLVFLGPLVRNRTENAMGNIGSTLLGVAYCWYLLFFAPKIRHLGLRHGWAYDGAELLLISVFIAKLCDSGGYFVGSRWGRTKLCPNISPKKTWEGFLGGIVACLGTMALVIWGEPDSAVASLGWGKAMLFALLLAVTSLLGDLVESCLKRDSQVKDAGGTMPGYGGVLDVLDSLMVALPAAYYYLVLVCGAHPGA